jgi:hypothetical protein
MYNGGGVVMKYEKLQEMLINIEKKNPFHDDADMKRAVEKIRSRELNKKFFKIDTDLISECTDTLLMLERVDVKKIDNEADERSAEDLTKIYVMAEESKKHSSEKTNNINSKLKPVIIMLVILICLFALNIIAYAFGFDVYSYIKNYGRELLNLPIDESITEYGITFTYHGDSKKYTDIEELFKEEQLDILYPSVLPDGETTKYIKKIEKVDNKFDILFIFTSENLGYVVYNYQAVDLNTLTDYTTCEVNGLSFYIFDVDSAYQAVCSYNGYMYCVIYNDYDNLLKILSNMKSIN